MNAPLVAIVGQAFEPGQAAKPDLLCGLRACLPILSHEPGFPDGAFLAELCAAAHLARFLIMLPLAQFLLNATAFEQLLEPAQRQSNWFSVVNTHP
jgi:hypothetical protein